MSLLGAFVNEVFESDCIRLFE